ncbi:adenosylcobinamide-phosphate synthase CbiB [Hydrogenophaga sp.]|uniref:adenosylcobinamide-phosphate synthase CbiB n=1 Tax=Hydrogenophaga sp. TaxID=1904254 RepID=UPI00272639B1|nr:adenosylcobinamide-phosphate synthase CbiB [Hydrogenophaga sp.]MDO9436596.1 adenosylcobinamide-phosphate synthase CbiB [Hydrogenophaga sp.]
MFDFSMPTLVTPLAVLVALAVDRVFGEPPARWHPVVAIGHYLSFMGRHIAPVADAASAKRANATNADNVANAENAAHFANATKAANAEPSAHAAHTANDARAFWLGSLAWSLGAAGIVALTMLLTSATATWPWWLQALVLGLFLKPLLAWRMLRDEVRSVEAALGESLAAGRERLSWLVSRDVITLDAAQVRESAIESLAENLNDSVVAPLFWFAIAGLPGAALYRFANTADAMWGYKGERNGRDWTWAGKWAARADDVLSWLPARMTGTLLGVLGATHRLRALPSQARRTPSPNSGWPMAAMALALDVRLGKPGVYQLHGDGRVAQSADTAHALRLAGRVVQVLGASACAWAVLAWR